MHKVTTLLGVQFFLCYIGVLPSKYKAGREALHINNG